MNSPHSSSQSATGESVARSKIPLLVCGPQMEGFSLRGGAGFRGEEVEPLRGPLCWLTMGTSLFAFKPPGREALGGKGWGKAPLTQRPIPGGNEASKPPVLQALSLPTFPKRPPPFLVPLHSVLNCPT